MIMVNMLKNSKLFLSDGALFSSGARCVAAATQTCHALAGMSLHHVKCQIFLFQDHAEKRNELRKSLATGSWNELNQKTLLRPWEYMRGVCCPLQEWIWVLTGRSRWPEATRTRMPCWQVGPLGARDVRSDQLRWQHIEDQLQCWHVAIPCFSCVQLKMPHRWKLAATGDGKHNTTMVFPFSCECLFCLPFDRSTNKSDSKVFFFFSKVWTLAQGWELSCCAACVGFNGAETQVIPDKVFVLFVASWQLKMFLFLDVPMQLDETSKYREFDHQSVEEQEECLHPAKYASMLMCLNGMDRRQDERERPRRSSLWSTKKVANDWHRNTSTLARGSLTTRVHKVTWCQKACGKNNASRWRRTSVQFSRMLPKVSQRLDPTWPRAYAQHRSIWADCGCNHEQVVAVNSRRRS